MTSCLLLKYSGSLTPVLLSSSLIERQVLTEVSNSERVLGNDGSRYVLVVKGLDILYRFDLMVVAQKLLSKIIKAH